jgi:hypothetical protein
MATRLASVVVLPPKFSVTSARSADRCSTASIFTSKSLPCLDLRARAHDRVLKVARTIPDLDSAERVSAKHLAEAVQYRWKSGLGRGLGDPSHEMVGSVPLLYSRGSVSRLART